MGGFHIQMGSFFVTVRALSVWLPCGFWAEFKILIFCMVFNQK